MTEAIDDYQQWLDRLLALPEQERDCQIRTDVAEELPARIEALLDAFVEEKAYEVVTDDGPVLDAVRNAVWTSRCDSVYKDLEARAAQLAEQAEEDAEQD